MEHSKTKLGSMNMNTDTKEKIKESASDLLNESKKYAHELYEQGTEKVTDKVNDIDKCVHEYSDKLVKKIHENPLSSVLIAVGVGALLSSLFKK